MGCGRVRDKENQRQKISQWGWKPLLLGISLASRIICLTVVLQNPQSSSTLHWAALDKIMWRSWEKTFPALERSLSLQVNVVGGHHQAWWRVDTIWGHLCPGQIMLLGAEQWRCDTSWQRWKLSLAPSFLRRAQQCKTKREILSPLYYFSLNNPCLILEGKVADNYFYIKFQSVSSLSSALSLG